MSDLTKQVPVTALSAPCTMLVSDKTEAGNSPIEMLARTSTVLDHWYWGPMIHDFSGMKHPEKIPVDFLHSQAEGIGYIDQFKVDTEGLKLVGELVSVAENDRADELRKKHKGGIPYQASIQYPHDDLLIQYIPSGSTTEVNGQLLEGPLTVFREWTLTGVAVCLHGYDPNTSTRMHRDAQHLELTIQGGSAMPGTPKEPEKTPVTNLTKPQQPETTPATEEPKQTELQTPAIPQANAKAEVITELKRYTDRFGPEGATYYVDGLTYEQALDKHARKTETELQAKQGEITELQTKLQSVVTGEEQPVSAGKAEGDKPKHSTGLGACIRIVGKDYGKS